MGHVTRIVAASASVAAALGVAGFTALTPAARAADGPTFRDCSFVGGLDPDFVRVLDTSPRLTVSESQQDVDLIASESTDPMDSSGGVTLSATISSPGIPSTVVKGANTGFVSLDIPLHESRAGRIYTITWSATFDSGNHPCPGATLPTTTDGTPFKITVGGSRD
jgi:hypothetical protein